MLDVREQLGGYGEQLDSLMTPVEFEEIVADRARSMPVRPVRLPKLMDRLPGWAVGVAAALVVLVLIGGVAVLTQLLRGEQEPAVTQPTVTIPTGTRAPAEIDPLLGVPFEPTVPFVATVEVADEVIEGDDIVIEGPVLEVTHGGIVVDEADIRRFVGIRIDVINGQGGPDQVLPAPVTGSFVAVTDGGAGTFLADRNLFIRWTEGPFDAGEFTWRTWSEYCSLGSIEVGNSDEVAGRPVKRVTCTRANGTVELWVGTETGTVLRVEGSSGPSPLIGRNLGAYPRDFSVTAIDFEAEPANNLFLPLAPSGSSTLDGGERLRGLLAANPRDSVDSLLEHVETPTGHPLVGQPAPELFGLTLDGGKFDLTTHQGQTVVVLWWASWCAPGRSDLEILNAASAVRNDIMFVAVTLNDDPDLARQIATDALITIPIVDSAAANPEPSETWQIEACPVTLHVDEEGTVKAILENYGTVDELLDQL